MRLWRNGSLKGGIAFYSKSQHRLSFKDEDPPKIVQLLGSDPKELVNAARRAVMLGAQVIDFNCGCPARKVCNVACGSALLRNPKLIQEILQALVTSVDVPITLKFRTGWNSEENNALEVGEIAQKAGVSMLTLHGRTKDQGFKGEAEYETIKQLKKVVDIPVIANGDIDSSEKAIQVLEETGVDGLMVGRASLGNPWIFRSIDAMLHGLQYTPPSFDEVRSLMIEHMNDHFSFYGERNALRSFRKHLNWYLRPLGANDEDMKNLYQAIDQDSLEDRLLDLLLRLETQQ